MADDLAEFFFRRDYFYANAFAQLLISSQIDFRRIIINYVIYMFKINSNHGDSSKQHYMMKAKIPFDRNNEAANNSFLLIKSQSNCLLYIHEKQFNFLIYLVLVIVDKLSNHQNVNDEFDKIYGLITQFEYLNCDLDMALNDLVKRKTFTVSKSKRTTIQMSKKKESYLIKNNLDDESLETRLIINMIKSILESTKYATIQSLLLKLTDEYGSSTIASRLIVDKLEDMTKSQSAEFELTEFLRTRPNLGLDSLIEVVKSSSTSSSLVPKLETMRINSGEAKKSPIQIFSTTSALRSKTFKQKSTVFQILFISAHRLQACSELLFSAQILSANI